MRAPRNPRGATAAPEAPLVRALPHLLTASRGVAGLGVAGLLGSGHHVAAFFLYVIAVFTDLFDGWLARKLDARADIGPWLDPLADKLLGLTTWITLGVHGWAPPWLVLPMLSRDVLVVVSWLALRARGLEVAPTLSGKLMVAYEGVALAFLLIHVHWAGVHWESAGVVMGLIALWHALRSATEHAAALAAAARAPAR